MMYNLVGNNTYVFDCNEALIEMHIDILLFYSCQREFQFLIMQL